MGLGVFGERCILPLLSAEGGVGVAPGLGMQRDLRTGLKQPCLLGRQWIQNLI